MSNIKYNNIEYYKSELIKKDEIIEKLFDEVDNLKDIKLGEEFKNQLEELKIKYQELSKINHNLKIENENLKKKIEKLPKEKDKEERYSQNLDNKAKNRHFKIHKDITKYTAIDRQDKGIAHERDYDKGIIDYGDYDLDEDLD